MTIETIRSRAQFHALRENWNAVYRADPEAQFFLSWQWLWQLYDRRDEDMQILAYRGSANESFFSAFLPLRRQVHLSHRHHRFSTIYRLPGNFWADYTGLLCVPDCEYQAILAFGEYLAGLPWKHIFLENLLISDARLDILLTPLRANEYSIRTIVPDDTKCGPDLRRSPRIHLPSSFETYMQTKLSANTRQRIRRFRRKLHADPELGIRASNARTVDDDLLHFERMWIARWATEKREKVHKLAKRYSLILRQAIESGDMYMPVMVRAHSPIGMIASYIDREKRTLLFYVASRDLGEEKFPIGLLLHADSIEWAVQRRFLYYDMLRGDEAYKYSLGARDQFIRTLIITVDRNHSVVDTLDESFVDSALIKLRKYEKVAQREVIERLYRQLATVWPNDDTITRSRANWLASDSNCNN